MTTDAAQQQQAQQSKNGDGDQSAQDGQQAGGGAGQQQQAGAGQQQQTSAEQQQQAQATQADAAAAEGQGTDGQQKPADPYTLLAQLLETEAGQSVVVTAGSMLSEQPAAAPQPAAAGAQVTTAPATPTTAPRRAELEAVIAAGGDEVVQAKADLFDLSQVERGRETIVAEGREIGKLEALREIFQGDKFQALDKAQRTELSVQFKTLGAAATLNRALEMVTTAAQSGDGQQAQGTAEQQADRSKANQAIAGQQQNQPAPALVGAASSGGAPEIRQGQSSESALNDFFAYADQQK